MSDLHDKRYTLVILFKSLYERIFCVSLARVNNNVTSKRLSAIALHINIEDHAVTRLHPNAQQTHVTRINIKLLLTAINIDTQGTNRSWGGFILMLIDSPRGGQIAPSLVPHSVTLLHGRRLGGDQGDSSPPHAGQRSTIWNQIPQNGLFECYFAEFIKKNVRNFLAQMQI